MVSETPPTASLPWVRWWAQAPSATELSVVVIMRCRCIDTTPITSTIVVVTTSEVRPEVRHHSKLIWSVGRR